MNSIFSSKGLLPNLKRRSRTRSKHDIVSPSKAKPLDILPGLAEEEENRWSTSSASTSSCSTPVHRSIPAAARPSSDVKRDSRKVVLTGIEGLTFDDFFPLSNAPPRPAPAPPIFTKTESPLDEINLRFSGLGIAMDFPSPPRSSISSRRDQSPTPSESSSHTSASGSSSTSRKSSSTPPTSDDESSKPRLSRSPTCKSQRASVLFMKSMPDLPMPAPTPTQPVSFIPELDEEEDSDSEDASWFAEDISDVIMLSSHLPPSFPTTPTGASPDPRARPDSLPPPPRSETLGRSRQGKVLPVLPRLNLQLPSSSPSSQLDPTFATSPYRRFIPTRPPPPPPIRIETCPSPTMEEKTDELLSLLANAALGTGFLGTGLRSVEEPLYTPCTPSSVFAISSPESARPPPRSAIPADISDFMDDGPLGGDDGSVLDLSYYSESGLPSTPQSISVYSQASLVVDTFPGTPMSSFDFQMASEPQTPIVSEKQSSTFPALPESPDVGMYSSNSLASSTTPPSDTASMTRERTLRSRWSSSTLSSLDASRQTPPSASSWMVRFHIGNNSPPKPRSPKAAKKASGFKVPLSPTTKRSLDMERGLTRRESTDSRLSIDTASDSGDSTSSSGLRRKPIPVEIFMR